VIERCAIYCRLSYAPDGSVEAVTRQEETARSLAARLGWPVAQVYVDNNISAWKRGVRRPAWERMLGDLRSGARDAIIVYHGDRLIRRGRDLEDLLDLADARQLSIASVSGTRDLSNADDRYVLRLDVASAIRESDNISRRVKAAIVAAAEAGRPKNGRFRPYGYEKDGVTVSPLEASVIREMAGRVLAGQSVGSVVRWLNDSRTATVTGARWIPATVRSILTNPRHAGMRTMHGKVIAAAQWEGILDLATMEDLRAVIAPVRHDQAVHKVVPMARAHLLTNLARCGSCGAGLRSMRRSRRRGVPRTGRLYYCHNPQCPGPKVGRDESLLDEFIIGAMLELLNRPLAIEKRRAARRSPGLGGQIAALERRMGDEAVAFRAARDDPDYDPVLVMQRIGSYKRRIAELRQQMDAGTRSRLLDGHEGATREQWDSWPLEVRRALIAALLTVTVLPSARRGPGFDPDCVRLSEPAEDE